MFRLQEIVQEALVNSGVVSSFNPDEIPEDYESTCREMFIRTVVPKVNCDKTLDITKRMVEVMPDASMSYRFTAPQTWFRGRYLGDVTSTAADMASLQAQVDALRTFGIAVPGDFPMDDLSQPQPCYCWTADGKMVLWNDYPVEGSLGIIIDRYNTRTPVTYIKRVLDHLGREVEIVECDQFFGEYANRDDVCYVEEDDTSLAVFFRKREPYRVVVPVPVSVVTAQSGERFVRCPVKFRPYLVHTLSVCVAKFYNMDTEPKCKEEALTAYSAIVAGRQPMTNTQDASYNVAKLLGRR